jgi:hypothetical protein
MLLELACCPFGERNVELFELKPSGYQPATGAEPAMGPDLGPVSMTITVNGKGLKAQTKP